MVSDAWEGLRSGGGSEGRVRGREAEKPLKFSENHSQTGQWRIRNRKVSVHLFPSPRPTPLLGCSPLPLPGQTLEAALRLPGTDDHLERSVGASQWPPDAHGY